jgi:hypothetical protein
MAERLLNRTTTLSLAVGALLLGFSFSPAQATPAVGMTPRVAESTVEKAQFGCMRSCLRRTDLPPWACRRRCYRGAGSGEYGGRCVRRCLARTDLSPWACRRKCYGGYGRFDRDRRFYDRDRRFGDER